MNKWPRRLLLWISAYVIAGLVTRSLVVVMIMLAWGDFTLERWIAACIQNKVYLNALIWPREQVMEYRYCTSSTEILVWSCCCVAIMLTSYCLLSKIFCLRIP